MKRSESFKSFLKSFELEKEPVLFNQERVAYYSQINKVLSEEQTRQFIGQNWPKGEETEEVEYVPCCRLEIKKDIYSLVYWRASIGEYAFYLASFNKNGILIDRLKIASYNWLETPDCQIQSHWNSDNFFLCTKINGSSSEIIGKAEVLDDGQIYFTANSKV